MIEGELQVTIDGATEVVRAGVVAIVPSNAPLCQSPTDGCVIVVDYPRGENSISRLANAASLASCSGVTDDVVAVPLLNRRCNIIVSRFDFEDQSSILRRFQIRLEEHVSEECQLAVRHRTEECKASF